MCVGVWLAAVGPRQLKVYVCSRPRSNNCGARLAAAPSSGPGLFAHMRVLKARCPRPKACNLGAREASSGGAGLARKVKACRRMRVRPSRAELPRTKAPRAFPP